MDSARRILSADISKESEAPLYDQLMRAIRGMITDKLLKPGDLIPGEYAFCKAYGLSRSTVRRAIRELEERGLVIRRRGLGTFISEPKLNRSINRLYSFTNEIKRMGMTPSSVIREFQTIRADEALREILKLPEGETEVHSFTRLRCASGDPLLLETTAIPSYLFPGLTKTKLARSSLYTLLREEAGVIPFSATETYESTIIAGEVAGLLECGEGASGFIIERVAWNQEGSVYEFTHSFMRGDRAKLVLNLHNDSVSGNLITPSLP